VVVSAAADAELPAIVGELLAAVAARDAARAARCFTEEGVYWSCVPRPPYRGRRAVEQMFVRLNSLASRIRWDVSACVIDGGKVWLEHVDRFWIDGRECVMECAGVLSIDGPSGLISQVRDYCDMETWLTQLPAQPR
jgi:limonene-1,2-epoxide hydrolase